MLTAPRGKKKRASAALQALGDLKPTGEVSDTPVDFAKLAAAATDGAPAKDPPGTGTPYIVDVYGRKAGEAMQIELTGTQMKRKKKGGFAREVRGCNFDGVFDHFARIFHRAAHHTPCGIHLVPFSLVTMYIAC